MKIICESWLFKLPFIRRYSAIVLGRRCFIKHSNYSLELLRHELVHQEQMDRVGMVSFYMIYLKDYLINLVRYRDHDIAYAEIPFEKEAYARQALASDLIIKSNLKV